MDPSVQPSVPENSASVDALPLNHRPVSGDVHTEDSVEEHLGFPSPSIDWKLNIFLGRLANEITDEELGKIKHLFTSIIGKGLLQRIETAEELFRVMRQRDFLNNYNLLYLQTILFEVNRRDLVKQCIAYARSIRNVLHFTTPQGEPVEGFQHVKFHVEGPDFSNFSRRYVETLRQTVADMLFVPRENVFVAGIEPSSSMLVVLMIPDLYVQVLVEMLEDNTNFEELAEIGVDLIGVNDKQYNIRGIDEAEIVLSDQQEKLVNVYKQLETKTKQLEERQMECLSLHKRLKSVDKNRLTSEAQLAIFTKIFNNVFPEEIPKMEFKPATLESQAALEEFKSILKFAEATGHEKDFIIQLLEANTTVIVNRLKESYQLQFNRLRIEIDDLQSTVIPLQLELQKHQFVTQVSSGQLDEIIFESLANAIERKLKAEVTISLSVHYLKATTAISKKLRLKEKIKLKDQYDWLKDDPLTDTIEKEPNLFLCCIYLKEVEKQGTVVEPVSFLTQQLNQINRKDLVSKLQTMTMQSPVSASKKKTKTAADKRGQGPHIQGDKGPKESQSTGSQVELEFISRKVESIQDKVESIYKVLNGVQCKPPSYASLYTDKTMYPSRTGKRYPYGNTMLRKEADTEQ